MLNHQPGRRSAGSVDFIVLAREPSKINLCQNPLLNLEADFYGERINGLSGLSDQISKKD